MKIDKPSCGITVCRNNFDCNCKDQKTYDSCEFKSEITALVEKVYEKYPEDKDIWLLLQSVVDLKQKVEKIYSDLYE